MSIDTTTTTAAVDTLTQRRQLQEQLRRSNRSFRKAFEDLHERAEKARNTDNVLCANLHLRVAALCANYADRFNAVLPKEDLDFLRYEVTTRNLLALILKSLEVSGLGDLAISLGGKQRLEEEYQQVYKKIFKRLSDEDEGEEDIKDPRDGKGLYEFIPYEQLANEKLVLIGYEQQRIDILNSYYCIVEEEADDGSRGSGGGGGVVGESSSKRSKLDDDLSSSAKTKQGTNVILYGPPGTGKTVTAKRTAIDLRLNFVYTNIENLLSKYRSETEKNLRTLYASMRRLIGMTKRNVLLLLDEADGIVKSRTETRDLSTADHRLLSRFLQILEPNDGSDNFGIISVFTTNYLKGIDDAFRRRCKTIFFGRMDDSETRATLIRHLFDPVIEPRAERDSTIVEEMSNDTTEYWVPGDFVRFKKDVVDRERVRMYKQLTNVDFFDVGREERKRGRAALAVAATGEREFGAREFSRKPTERTTEEKSVPRVIRVNLPKITYETVARLAKDFKPTTPKEKYHDFVEAL